MQPLICLLVATTFVFAPMAARAEERGRLRLPAIVDGCAGAICIETAIVRKGDSLKNGAAIGAVLGGLALGGFATFLCNALREEGNPPCWKGVLTIAAVGAGIGAAAGAGIDALLSRGTGTTGTKGTTGTTGTTGTRGTPGATRSVTKNTSQGF